MLLLFLSCSFQDADPLYLDLNGNGEMDIYENPQVAPKERAKDLVARLTPEEKAGLMGSNAIAVKRLGIKAFGWDNEGKHAMVSCFPTSIGIAASWNVGESFEIANALSDEARILSRQEVAKGRTMRYLSFWAPTINMARDPRWGRTMETYSEDPYLTSQIAVPFIKGMQGSNSKYLKTVAGVNHMAAYNRELGRHELNAEIKDEKQLREYYLESFKRCVTEGGNEGIGASNNAVNGVPACVNKWLLTDILRDEWGYKGYVFSDAASVSDVAGIRHYAPTHEQAIELAVKAGCDIDCGNSFQGYIGKALHQQLLNNPQLDSSLVRSMTVRFRLGMFDPEKLNPYHGIPDTLLDGGKHRQLALSAAREAMVLLKNDKQVLPLSQAVKTIVLAGPRADEPELGRKQTGRSAKNISALQGIKNRFENARVLYSKDINQSVNQAKNADVVIYCTSLMEGEVADRLNLRLSSRQESDIIKLSKLNKPVIVVLYSGATVDVSPWIHQVDGLIEAWYPGEEGGNALADVIAGNYNPSGKLPVTFYSSTTVLPPFDDFDITHGRTYMYQKSVPRYPFGFGLSYTSFKIEAGESHQKNGSLYINASVTNTGKKDGAEVVQLYMNYTGDQSRTFPAKQLKGFKKVFLKAGESKRLQFVISPADLAFYDNAMNWKVFAGNYHITLGNSSANVSALATFKFDQEIILKKGPQLIYSQLNIPGKNIIAGEFFPVDFYCENRGQLSGKGALMVDGQPFTMPDAYLGPGQSGRFRFMVQLPGATKHSIGLIGKRPVVLTPSVGNPALAIKSVTSNQLYVAGEPVDFKFITVNNGSNSKSFNYNLSVNGKEVKSQNINLKAGEQKTISFKYTFTQPGAYDIALNGEGKTRAIVGGKPQQPFAVFANTNAAFYQVNAQTFWGFAGGAIGGTPIANNYGERTADDAYGAIYLPGGMTDNSVATVRIHQQQKTSNYAKAGIMVRNKINQPGNATGYVVAAVSSYYGGGGLLEWDHSGHGYLDSLRRFSLAPFPDKWIRVERHQKQYIIWSSADGQHWKKQTNIISATANAVQDVGVFITSDNPAELCHVIFSDFTVFKSNAFLKETDISKPIKKEKQFTTEPL